MEFLHNSCTPMELLAPAGGFEQLRAAINFGANAVYLAAEKFGMRARAANFTLEELPQAVKEAHDAGVAVYVTCNITIMENDLSELPPYLQAVDASGADALIIGDMGAFALAREHAPHCKLHVSTQANVANSEAACAWHALGASRIVCAREMTLADIARMRQEVPPDLEIEAFVHGAQCMAISGRCLISSYLTGRSGNQGNCTQPCRWNYALEEEKRPGVFFPVEEDERGTFIMNAKDLNMLRHLAELQNAGINSIKIEGRNKKAFYVATVVGAYRRALDALASPELALPELAEPELAKPELAEQNSARSKLAESKTSELEFAELIDQLEAELMCVSHRPYGEGFYFGDPQQTCDYDGYEQETLHVADVIACEKSGDNAFELTLRCRNRFAEGDALEALVPRDEVRNLVVRNLNWLPDESADVNTTAINTTAINAAAANSTTASTNAVAHAEPVAVANRASEIYAITVDFPVPPGSFLRSRQHRRSARHFS